MINPNESWPGRQSQMVPQAEYSTVPTGLRGPFFTFVYPFTGICGTLLAWAMSFHLGVLFLLGWPIAASIALSGYWLIRNEVEPREVRLGDGRFQLVTRRSVVLPWINVGDARVFSWGRFGGGVAIGRHQGMRLWYLSRAQVEGIRSLGAPRVPARPGWDE